MLDGARVPVVIVGYRNPRDIVNCLAALASGAAEPSFAVFICENGGALAFDDLLDALSTAQSPCSGLAMATPSMPHEFARIFRGRLGADGPWIHVGEAGHNLGYAGGVNAWLRPLRELAGWDGVWVLNPDTLPDSNALAELVACSRARAKGMVGSRIMFVDNPDIIGSRGLKWRRVLASTLGVDKFGPAARPHALDDIEAQIDAPHGASFYVTHDCLERVGLMNEDYFLFFEDLDWGLRAKAVCGVGYAYDSVVPHIGGSTIGSATARAARSELSVYLDFRNRLIFVRRHYPAWFTWTALMAALRTADFLFAGSPKNFRAALRGVGAGLIGETGRPKY